MFVFLCFCEVATEKEKAVLFALTDFLILLAVNWMGSRRL